MGYSNRYTSFTAACPGAIKEWNVVMVAHTSTKAPGWFRQVKFSSVEFLLKIVVVVSLLASARSECEIVKCQTKYTNAVRNLNAGPNLEFCEAVVAFKGCVNNITPQSCRGDLNYHSALTVIPDLMRNYDCDRVIKNSPPPMVNDTPTDVSGRCQFNGKTKFRHCGLFGDPHLRTFEDEFLTCKAAGAWLLIYNKYLTVQVTNLPLTHGRGATATTKLTIVIKQYEQCTEERLYEVKSGYLPNTFVDGTGSSGSVSFSEIVAGEHVEIHMEHIATVMIIRQIGKYITFAVKMPEELIQTHGENDIQLCVKGCPHSQRITYTDFLTKTEKVDTNFVTLRDDAVTKCRNAQVIDVYLDSCVFDLLATGDSSFTRAAQSALSDVTRLHPHASSLFVNRTSIFENEEIVWQLTYGNAAPPRTRLRTLLTCELLLAFIILIFFQFSFTHFVNR